MLDSLINTQNNKPIPNYLDSIFGNKSKINIINPNLSVSTQNNKAKQDVAREEENINTESKKLISSLFNPTEQINKEQDTITANQDAIIDKAKQSKTYDNDVLQQYFDGRDYFGAADYMEQTLTNTEKVRNSPDLKNQLYNDIKEIRKKGEIQKAMISRMSFAEQQAFELLQAYNGDGALNKSGSSKEYSDLINGLVVNQDVISPGGRNVKGERIKAMRITFGDDISYQKWLKSTGQTSDSSEFTVKKDSKTGSIRVEIPTNNLKMPEYVTKTYELDKFITMPHYGYENPGANDTIIKGNYNIEAVTTSNIIVDNKYITTNINQAANLIENAKNITDKALEKYSTVNTMENIMVSSHLSLADADNYNQWKNGKIDTEEYNRRHNIYKDQCDTLLKGMDVYNHDIYTTYEDDDDKEGHVLKKVDNKDKDIYKSMILVAMAENRLSYSSALSGGEEGAYIEIAAKTDKDGNPVDGDLGKEMRIFIPGLFRSGADSAFNADTKTMALRDAADMERFMYGKELASGEYVGYNELRVPYILDENGEQQAITQAEMLQKLNEDNFINATVFNISRNVFDNPKGNDSYQKLNDEGEIVHEDIGAYLELLAGSFVESTNNNYNIEENLLYKNKLYTIMLNKLRRNNITYNS